MLIYYCNWYIFPQRIHSFQNFYEWTNENADHWGFQKEMSGITIAALICWKSKKFIWLHLGCIHELQKSRKIEDSLSLSIVFLFILHKWLRCWIPNPGVPWSKPLGGFKVDSAFHPSEVVKMSTKNIWGT